jgi:hypothetical protein
MTQIGRENIVSRVDGVLHVANEMSKADLIFLVRRACQDFRVWPELLNIFRSLPL